MMRFLLALCFLSFYFIGFCQLNGQVQWTEERPIEWNDFSGNIQKGSGHHALTASGISINMRQDIPDTVTITVLANFHPDKSWLKKDKSTDHLLNHERKHFDIAEIFRRKLMKNLLTGDALKSSNINELVDRAYKENDQAMLNYQIRYDKETRHSQDLEEQIVWDKKIAKDLESLKDYAHSEIKIPMAQILQMRGKTKTTKRRKRNN